MSKTNTDDRTQWQTLKWYFCVG